MEGISSSALIALCWFLPAASTALSLHLDAWVWSLNSSYLASFLVDLVLYLRSVHRGKESFLEEKFMAPVPILPSIRLSAEAKKHATGLSCHSSGNSCRFHEQLGSCLVGVSQCCLLSQASLAKLSRGMRFVMTASIIGIDVLVCDFISSLMSFLTLLLLPLIIPFPFNSH